MNKEIGGYFELEKISDNGYEYHSDLIRINSARNCLLYIVKVRNIEKLYIPYYLCNSIKNMCINNGIPFEQYHIDENFLPVLDSNLKENECLLLVNYYGGLSRETINGIFRKYNNQVIIDSTQAFFERYDNVDAFYSCRKFFGVPDGGYLNLITDKRLELDIDDSAGRDRHLLGRLSGNASDHYLEYRDNERLIATLPMRYMSSYTKNIMEQIDYNHVIEIRNNNYDYLHKKLSKINKCTFQKPNGPFCYPLLVDNGKELRNKLIQNKIYVPLYWPDIECNKLEQHFVENILPIPCDQRYGKEDLELITLIISTVVA